VTVESGIAPEHVRISQRVLAVAAETDPVTALEVMRRNGVRQLAICQPRPCPRARNQAQSPPRSSPATRRPLWSSRIRSSSELSRPPMCWPNSPVERRPSMSVERSHPVVVGRSWWCSARVVSAGSTACCSDRSPWRSPRTASAPGRRPRGRRGEPTAHGGAGRGRRQRLAPRHPGAAVHVRGRRPPRRTPHGGAYLVRIGWPVTAGFPAPLTQRRPLIEFVGTRS
jgi:hypothetical protein